VTELEYIKRVLAAFDAWGKEDVLWRVNEDGVRFFALVNDVFWWGSADGEDIRPEDLELLERSKADLVAIEGQEPTCLPELYAARKRGLRPQGAWYAGVDPEVYALFDACGPARAVGLSNPRRHPSEVE
jgi:hypothetical protein